MFGSTIIVEKDPVRLKALADVENLDNFVYLHLDTMATIDFETIVGGGGRTWIDGEPILFDEDGGVALFKVNEDGLNYVLSQESLLSETQVGDLRKLAEFVRVNGTSNIYELTTF